MQRLKTFDQHKKEKTITKPEDVSVEPIESEAAEVFKAEDMLGITSVGTEIKINKD